MYVHTLQYVATTEEISSWIVVGGRGGRLTMGRWPIMIGATYSI